MPSLQGLLAPGLLRLHIAADRKFIEDQFQMESNS